MNAILIKADSKSNKEIYKLAKKLGGDIYPIKNEQFEDFALGILMDKVKTNQVVSRNEILRKLRKK